MASGAQRVLAQFEGLGLGARVYGRVRWSISPFDRVLPHVPERGRVLDVGCGSGMWLAYLALERPNLSLVGLDPDKRKLDIARHASKVDLDLRQGSARELPDGPFDCITIFDVLYLLPDSQKSLVIRACLESLAAGGSLLVKELDVRPRWKFFPAALEELVAVRLVNLTEGDQLHFQGLAELEADFESAGFSDVVGERVDRGYLHPHVLVRGTRPEGV